MNGLKIADKLFEDFMNPDGSWLSDSVYTAYCALRSQHHKVKQLESDVEKYKTFWQDCEKDREERCSDCLRKAQEK